VNEKKDQNGKNQTHKTQINFANGKGVVEDRVNISKKTGLGAPGKKEREAKKAKPQQPA